jgi:short-subunit dehydrogenase
MKIGSEGQTWSLGTKSQMREPCTNIERRSPTRQWGIAVREPVAVVTGASSGIGRALALELAGRGYQVGLLARRRKALEDLACQIGTRGGKAQMAAADVGDRQALHAGIQQIERILGPVDVIVANAGLGTPTRLDPLNVADVEDTFRVNVLGVVYSIEAVLPGMLDRGWGQLVAISSMASFKGLPGESAYCASKAAVNLYMEGLRIALRNRGIAVTTICPGFVATAITPMAAATPFEITAEAAARRIARAIDQRKSGLIRFPWPMAMLMALICRLPDFLVAHLVGHEECSSRPLDTPSR